jgi:hypothetical protein
MLMTKRAKGLPAALIFVLCVTSTAGAQSGDSARVGIEPLHSEPRPTPRPGVSPPSREARPPLSAAAAWKYPLIGVLVGAGATFTVIYIGSHQRHIKSHSEDGYAYAILLPIGTVAGLIGGIAVYLVRAR